MCLLVFAVDCHPACRLVIAANRDEYFIRPTAAAAFWCDAPQVLAGRDLQAGGTWLGITRSGRLAALTNYYGPGEYARDKLSRGWLISGFLIGNTSPDEYLRLLQSTGERYNGFSLVFGDTSGLSYYSNRGPSVSRIPVGIHGLSNHLLDTPWPKVSAAKLRLRRLLRKNEFDPEDIFGILSDPSPFSDHLLPDTGVGLERERSLSSLFVIRGEFGTRCSTVILIDQDNRMRFIERSFDDRQRTTGTVEFCLDLVSADRGAALRVDREEGFIN